MTYVRTLIILLVYLGLFFVVQPLPLAVVWLAVGMVIGIGLMILDERWAYRWYREPESSPDSSSLPYLITRSPLFWLAYVPLAIFVATSSGSWIGMGVVLGIGTVLWNEMWQLYRQPAAFEQRFLSQVKRRLTAVEIQRLMVIATGVLVTLGVIIVW